MRSDFSRFLKEIEGRWRRQIGLACACRLLFFGSLASLAGSFLLRGFVPSVEGWLVAAVVLMPPVAAFAAFLRGRSRRPDMSHLLLRLDDALEMEAQLSSLYEIRNRGEGSYIRQHLERTVVPALTHWRHALMLPKRTIGFLSAGSTGVLLALVVCLLPVRFLPAFSTAVPSQSETSGRAAEPIPWEAGAESTLDVDDASTPLMMQQEAAISNREPTLETTGASPGDEVSLDSVLDDLSSFSRSQAQVDAPVTSEELQELATAQENARQALSDMIQDLQRQMEGNPRPLTQQESQTLQDLGSQTGDPEIEDRTDEVVDEPNPDQIGEKLQDLLEQVDPHADDPETSPDTNDEESGDGSNNDSPQSTEISGDEEAGQRFLEQTAQDLQDQANAGSESEGESSQPATPPEGENAQEPSQEDGGEVPLGGTPEDQSQFGGEEGFAGISNTPPEAGELGFIREEAPSSIGAEGDFVDEFLTKGVPVERERSTAKPVSYVVDFNQIGSILRDRELPEEALDAVRRYFELITQPEGGS